MLEGLFKLEHPHHWTRIFQIAGANLRAPRADKAKVLAEAARIYSDVAMKLMMEPEVLKKGADKWLVMRFDVERGDFVVRFEDPFEVSDPPA